MQHLHALDLATGDGQVSLSWPASRDAITYTVNRSIKDAEPFETIAGGLTSTTFTDITVGNGMMYQYAVTAVNSNGESAPSTAATFFLPEPKWNLSLLPPGPGREITVRVCSGCHAPVIAAKEHLSPQGWHDIVQVMAARGAIATADEFNEITAYLAKSFPEIGPQP